ncbi:MAG: DNA mismatch repair endonuclease MutH [Myxococcota bacterium]
MPVAPPDSEAVLLARADALAGRPVRWLAEREQVAVPPDLKRHKGWIGNLLERALGATAGSKAEPDFPHLAVEMKTLPVDMTGKPRESTFVCHAPLDGSMAREWASSWVRRKLSRVLWVPIVGGGPPGDRVIGAPILWSPSAAQASTLQADWETLCEAINLGETWQLEARRGRALQLRPKAARASELTWVLDDEGDWAQVNPRGFYLRTSFTAEIVSSHLAVRTER